MDYPVGTFELSTRRLDISIKPTSRGQYIKRGCTGEEFVLEMVLIEMDMVNIEVLWEHDHSITPSTCSAYHRHTPIPPHINPRTFLYLNY